MKNFIEVTSPGGYSTLVFANKVELAQSDSDGYTSIYAGKHIIKVQETVDEIKKQLDEQHDTVHTLKSGNVITPIITPWALGKKLLDEGNDEIHVCSKKSDPSFWLGVYLYVTGEVLKNKYVLSDEKIEELKKEIGERIEEMIYGSDKHN